MFFKLIVSDRIQERHERQGSEKKETKDAEVSIERVRQARQAGTKVWLRFKPDC